MLSPWRDSGTQPYTVNELLFNKWARLEPSACRVHSREHTAEVCVSPTDTIIIPLRTPLALWQPLTTIESSMLATAVLGGFERRGWELRWTLSAVSSDAATKYRATLHIYDLGTDPSDYSTFVSDRQTPGDALLDVYVRALELTHG